MHKLYKPLGVLAVIFLCGAHVVPSNAQNRDVDSTYSSQTKPSRDPRLPPLLPGETVETESGDTMKVWSSSGAVSTGQPPAPPAPGHPGNVDVFVDRGDRGSDGFGFRERKARGGLRYDNENGSSQ